MRPILHIQKSSLSGICLLFFINEKGYLEEFDVRKTDSTHIILKHEEQSLPLLIDQDTCLQSLEVIMLYINERYFFPEMLSEKHDNILLLRHYMKKFITMISHDQGATASVMPSSIGSLITPEGFFLSNHLSLVDMILTTVLHKKSKNNEPLDDKLQAYYSAMREKTSFLRIMKSVES